MRTLLKISFCLIGGVLLLLLAWVLGGNFEQKRTENRVRHYFAVAKNQPLTETNIQSALLLQFPVGTPEATVEKAMTQRGLSGDGRSTMWQTNDVLYCQPYDYSDGLISMRRIQVCFSFDEQKHVKAVDVSCFSYSL